MEGRNILNKYMKHIENVRLWQIIWKKVKKSARMWGAGGQYLQFWIGTQRRPHWDDGTVSKDVKKQTMRSRRRAFQVQGRTVRRSWGRRMSGMFERTERAVFVRRFIVGDGHRRTGNTASIHVNQVGWDGKPLGGFVWKQNHLT